MMAKVDGFLDSLINYDKEHIHPDVVKAIQPYLKDPEFDPDFIAGKSLAAAGKHLIIFLCISVICIYFIIVRLHINYHVITIYNFILF